MIVGVLMGAYAGNRPISHRGIRGYVVGGRPALLPIPSEFVRTCARRTEANNEIRRTGQVATRCSELEPVKYLIGQVKTSAIMRNLCKTSRKLGVLA